MYPRSEDGPAGAKGMKEAAEWPTEMAGDGIGISACGGRPTPLVTYRYSSSCTGDRPDARVALTMRHRRRPAEPDAIRGDLQDRFPVANRRTDPDRSADRARVAREFLAGSFARYRACPPDTLIISGGTADHVRIAVAAPRGTLAGCLVRAPKQIAESSRTAAASHLPPTGRLCTLDPVFLVRSWTDTFTSPTRAR